MPYNTPDSEEFRIFHRGFQDNKAVLRHHCLTSQGMPHTKRRPEMPRYLVERKFPEGLNIPINNDGGNVCSDVIARNAEGGVTWIQSFVSPDRKQSFCIYDAPNPEAITTAAQKNALPVTRITEVRVLDPYFYH
jgi:Protein of unknown function (DUF4242)